jgi:hypothetical protein
MELVQVRVPGQGSLFALLKNMDELYAEQWDIVSAAVRKFVLWSVRSYRFIILSENCS